MTDDLRKPFFVLAMVLLVLALLVELGATQIIGAGGSVLPAEEADGLGVSSLATLDALLVLTVGLMGLALLLPERVQGRVQGIVSLVVALLVALASLVLLLSAIQLICLMLGLLLSPIFGTVAYMAAFGHFERDAAAVILALLLLLKLGFVACLVLAHQRFVENRGLVLLSATSVLCVLVVGWLHALVPGALVSIADTAGAIVVAVLALVWAIVFVFSGLKSIIKVVA